MNLPTANRNENLIHSKFSQPFNILENLKRSESPQESFEFEVFQAFQNWTSKEGPQLNVVLIPVGGILFSKQ